MGFGKDGKGVILRESRSQALGTLAANTALFIGTKLAMLERFRMLKAEMMATVVGLTGGEGTGLYMGLCDGDLSITELEQAIEGNGPLGPNDIVPMNIAERPTWWLGATDHEIATEAVFHNQQGGPNMEVMPRWTFARTKSWNWFVYNFGTVLTAGSTVTIRVKDFGVWVL